MVRKLAVPHISITPHVFKRSQTQSWREQFAPRIQRLLVHYDGQPEACQRALKRYYPLPLPWHGGPSYPYRIWRDEIARQRGQKESVKHHAHNPRCGHTLDLFAPQDRCQLTLDLFE